MRTLITDRFTLSTASLSSRKLRIFEVLSVIIIEEIDREIHPQLLTRARKTYRSLDTRSRIRTNKRTADIYPIYMQAALVTNV